MQYAHRTQVKPAGTVTTPSTGTANQPEPALYSSCTKVTYFCVAKIKTKFYLNIVFRNISQRDNEIGGIAFINRASVANRNRWAVIIRIGSGPVPSSTMVAVPVSVPWTGPRPVTSTVKFSGPS
ncbi:hypothetical protein [Vibrio campbellii]|uniref:hypothetical protein n=1 Tax=Vibrio campbellii TaxID=680 RepID=UPI002A18A156|nr:hypothetical protein [Vibrio campbellii]